MIRSYQGLSRIPSQRRCPIRPPHRSYIRMSAGFACRCRRATGLNPIRSSVICPPIIFFLPPIIPHSIRRRGYHRIYINAVVAGGGMDELQNHSLQTMNLVWRGNAIGSTGFAAVAPRLKALLYGVAERVEQKPLLHICHHMNGTALWRFEHMPLVVVSE